MNKIFKKKFIKVMFTLIKRVAITLFLMLEYLIVIPAMLEHSRSPEGGGVNDEKI